MQHRGAPTRLLDWSDGSLIALHFALRDNPKDGHHDAVVYVLEPDRLDHQLESLPEFGRAYVEKYPSENFSEDEWGRLYLPANEEELKEGNIPRVPLVLDFPHITRRVAAQRSRFIVFGSDPSWLSEALKQADAPIKVVTIDASSIATMRIQLRDSGVTESVIFPDLDGLGREMQQLWEDRQ
jgi:FRG domain